MKRFLVAVMFGLMTIAAQAEASFDQIETLIEQKNYAAAASGLETVIQNHPKSAKAFYAMAQAQAGLGNLEKAQKALNIATGLNPTLDFAPSSSVQSLRDAITPQTAKIEAVHESKFLQYLLIITLVVGGVAGIYVLYMKKKEREDQEQRERDAKFLREEQARQAEEARKAKLSDIVAKPAKQSKTPTQATASIATSGPAVQQPLYTPQPTHTTVVNNTSTNDGLLTGILIGDMLNRHHDTPRVVEREVVREVPSSRSTRDSSWDDTPSTSSSRSSSWDDDSSSSSKRSSSWDSSSSSSSSSWDSGSSSSSSDSSSSSSWD